MSVLQSSYFYWCLALVCIVPLTVVFLNECIDRSRRGTGSYSDVLVTIRDIILPLLSVLVLLRFVFVVSEENLPTRLISTIFWLALIVAVFRLTRKIIGSGSYSSEDWRSVVPHMFLRLPPYTIMGFIVFHIIQNLWSLPIREMATTLGIGSIVIAFALQDTLSNMVSGILLVANSPFKTGDWVHVGDVEGKISAVNWRYTNIETWLGDLVVIPIGSIAGESIENHSRPSKVTSIIQRFTFSFEHPPNKVSEMFDEVFRNTPGILKTPPAGAVVVNISDTAVEYDAEFWFEEYGTKADVHADFMSRVWYALMRHGITLPMPLYHVHSFSGVRFAAEEQRQARLLKSCVDWLPHFSQLPQETRALLADSSAFKYYAKNEIVINQLEAEPGLCVIVTGSARAVTTNGPGVAANSEVLHAGDFFGETGLFGRAVSPATVNAVIDTEILCIPHDLINEAINRSPDFASSISSIIDQRRARKEPIIEESNVTAANTSLPLFTSELETNYERS